MNLSINFQDIKWAEFKTTQFWFAIDRSMIHLSDKLFLVVGAILLVLAIIIFVYAQLVNNRFLSQVARRISKIFATVAILEGLWFLLRSQYVQVFGTRFVALLILLGGLIWLYWPIKYLVSNYKVDMEKAQREASREKYLNLKR